MKIKDCFKLGKFTKPFRYHGEVVLWMDVDDSNPYKGLKVVWAEERKSLIPYLVNRLKPHHDRFIATIEGINSEDCAKALCGKDIYLPLSELPLLNDDHFYFHEVEGWDVKDLNQDILLGKIVKVLDHSPYPMLEVDSDGTEVILPLPKDFKILVDRDKRVLNVEVPEGLVEVFTNTDKEAPDDEEIFPQ